MLLTLIKTLNLNPLLDKLSKENKQVFLLGHSNINLLNYSDHQLTNEFLDSLVSNSFIPHSHKYSYIHIYTNIYSFYSQPDLLVTPKRSPIIYFPI